MSTDPNALPVPPIPTHDTQTPEDAPDKVYICPACGQRYDEPTSCANGHPPTDAIEYDRATVAAADNGDAAALASISATALAATGTSAGLVVSEATPSDGLSVPAPVPAESVPAPAIPVDPAAAPVDPAAAPVDPAAAPVDPAAAPVDPAALVAQIETSIGNVIVAASAALDELAKVKTDLGL